MKKSLYAASISIVGLLTLISIYPNETVGSTNNEEEQEQLLMQDMDKIALRQMPASAAIETPIIKEEEIIKAYKLTNNTTKTIPELTPYQKAKENGFINYRLCQQDKKWGTKIYGNTTIGSGGCGITSLAMVNNILTGNYKTPEDLMNMKCDERGYQSGDEWKAPTYGSTQKYGTDSCYFPFWAEDLGMDYIMVRSPNLLRGLMERYECIAISKQGPGIFTEGGHYIVVAEMREDGVLVLDPTIEGITKYPNGQFTTIAMTGTSRCPYHLFFKKGTKHPTQAQIDSVDTPELYQHPSKYHEVMDLLQNWNGWV